MARSDRKNTPDFGNIYMYVNSLPIIVQDTTFTDNLYSLRLDIFKYHFRSNGRCIVYKKKHTETVDEIEYTGYIYYILGSELNVIRDYSSYSRRASVYSRGGVKSRLDGTNSEMYRIVSDSSFFDTDYISLSMGGSGNNGGWGGSNTQPDFSSLSNPTFIAPISKDTVTLSTTPNNSTLWIGVEPNVYNTSLRKEFYKKASSTYVSLNGKPWTSVRHVPWIWSDKGNADIKSWGELYSFIYNSTYTSNFTENVTSVEDIYDGEPLFLNVYISENYDECIKYLNNGTLPSDAKIIISNDGIPIYKKDDGNDDDKNTEEKGNPDDSTQGNPNHSIQPSSTPILGSVNVYNVSRDEMEKFISWFWNESITDSWTDILANTLTGMYGNLTQCITSIKKMPIPNTLFKGSIGLSTAIKVGRYTYTTQLPNSTEKIITSAIASTLVGTIDIDKKYNNFVDFAPYTALQMYLPYVGIIPLDTNLVMGRTIKVYAIASVYTSEIQYTLHASKDGVDTLIGVYVGKCGIDVPFSLDDASRIFSNVANNISGAISSLSGINLPDIGGTSAPMNISMQASNQLSVFTPEKCCLIAKRKRYQLPSNYGSKVGWKCGKKFGLHELVGFTVVENPIIKRWNGSSPTQAEIDEIYALLSSGVIL